MPLQQQTLHIPLLGLDTMSDPKGLPPGALVTAENCVIKRHGDGGIEYAKRYGRTALTTNKDGGGTISAGVRMGAFDDELLISDGVDIWAYSSGFTKWVRRGRAPRALVQSDGLAAGAEDQIPGDVAVSGDFAAFVWQEQAFGSSTADTRCAIKDLVSGAFVVVNAPMGSALSMAPRVVAIGSTFVFLYVSSGDLIARAVSTSTPTTIGSPVTLASDVHGTTKHIDAVEVSASHALVAYRYTGPGVKVLKIDATPSVVVSGALSHATAGDQAIGFLQWSFQDNNAYLAEGSSVAGVRVHTLDLPGLSFSSTANADAAATSVRNISGYYDSAATTRRVIYDVPAVTGFNDVVKMNGTDVLRSVSLTSKVFTDNGRWYAIMAYDATAPQAGFVLVDITFESSAPGRRAVGKSLVGNGRGATPWRSGLTSTPLSPGTTDSRYFAVLGTKVKIETEAASTEITYGVEVATLDFDASRIGGWVRAGSGMILPGGIPQWYDGKQIVELGYTFYPEAPTVAENGAGSMAAGTYQYVTVATWFDATGTMHRAASTISTVTIGASKQVLITQPTVRVTDRNNDYTASPSDTDITLDFYRTTAGGSLFYKASALASPTLRANNTAADTITFSDNKTDADLDDNEELFTDAQELEPIGPPSARCAVVYNNHVVLASSERPELWISKELRPGMAPEFSDEMVVQVPHGFVYSMQVMDGRLVLVHKDQISVLVGQGPNDQGVGVQDPPQKLTVPHGLDDPRPLATIPEGVLYKSARHGVRLLDRGFQDSYIGAAIDSLSGIGLTGDDAVVFTGAAVLPDVEQVRFTTESGRTFVYHWGVRDARGRGMWATHTNQGAVDCCVWQGKFTWLATSGTVRQESTSYSDQSSNITMKLITGWIRIAREQRLWEAQIIAQMQATCSLITRLAYDFDATVAESKTKNVTTSTLLPVAIRPARQEFMALRMTFEEASQTEGIRISAMDWELGVEPGMKRLATSQRAT